MRKLFITGIGTDVGKTVASAILVEALQADYWKPVQTGSYYGTDSEKIQKLIGNTKSVFFKESYSLEQYMSPHAAAETSGVEIDFKKIELPETNNSTLIIEGAGGVMVPLNQEFFMVDLMKKFDCEVILVVQNYLGSINHTLLSIEALKSRGIKLLGIILNGPPHKLSEDLIFEHTKVKLLGRINKEANISKEVISKYTDQFKNI
ncbi:MAG: dethiobiotin synthase [Bacteroidia bacterium]|nr:dethiobiotin synthase [Bacteroidia bacterium]